MRLEKLAPDCIYFLLWSSASLCSLINKKTPPDTHTLGALCLYSPATQLTPHQNAHLPGFIVRPLHHSPSPSLSPTLHMELDTVPCLCLENTAFHLVFV